MKPTSTSSDAPGARPRGPVSQAIPVLDLGLAPYSPLVRLQADLRTAVADGVLPGVLLLLEHEPVITLGSRGGEADLAGSARPSSPQLPVIKTERGGAATLHAPGQLVSYPILRIPRHDLRAFVDGLEQTLIDLLVGFGVSAERRRGAPGLYVRGAKIASVGLRCQRWVSSHGTSLNVSNDLGLFDAIVSCGEVGLRQTSILAEAGTAPSMPEVKQRYVETFSAVFAATLAPMLRSTAERAPADLGLR
ncbi:MAG: lipoyl(octanoyl) transferase LipB [Thermoleophilia bacterium]